MKERRAHRLNHPCTKGSRPTNAPISPARLSPLPLLYDLPYWSFTGRSWKYVATRTSRSGSARWRPQYVKINRRESRDDRPSDSRGPGSPRVQREVLATSVLSPRIFGFRYFSSWG